MNRRAFLKGAAATSASVVTSQLLPSFSLAQSQNDDGVGRNLIIFNLAGGLDHLTAFPYSDTANETQAFVDYVRTVRPVLHVLPSQMANSYLGFHQGLSPLVAEYQLGRLALIQGLGISPGQPPGGSHDVCQKIYSVGQSQYDQTSRGWFARFLELNRLVNYQAFGFGTGGRLDFLTERPEDAPVVGARVDQLTFTDPLDPNNVRVPTNLNFYERFLNAEDANLNRTEQRILTGLRQTAATARVMSDINGESLVGSYPDSDVGHTFKSIAKTLKHFSGRDSKDRIFYAVQNSFDSHSEIPRNLPGQLDHVGRAIGAFVADMRAVPGLYERTAIVAISEFGRSVRENGSEGSDHGWGTTMFALGGPIVGGVYGAPPDLAYSQAHNLCRAEIAFQNVLSRALDWMNLQYRGADLFPPNSYVPYNLPIFT